jgi:hypothetical protein
VAVDQPSVKVQVPKLNTDFIWSLRSWPAHIYLGGQEFEVPPLPATDWIVGILGMDKDVLGLLNSVLTDEDMDRLTDIMFKGGVEPDFLFDTTMQLLTTVGARPWWITMRLVVVMQQHWDSLGAELMLRGVDANKLSLSAWLDVALLTMIRMMDPKEVSMFTIRLEMIPPQFADQVTEESMEMTPEAFLSMAG